jgi:GDSL-like Lipase/Acylhydrolase
MSILFTFAVLTLAATGGAAYYTEIVAFGDSLTDRGNRSLASNKADVKFRQTWVAHLAGPKMLNLPNFKPSGHSFYYGGTNYAVGGDSTEFSTDLASDRNRRPGERPEPRTTSHLANLEALP